ncbi:NHLP family bacteriocin export ABC transporter peptidase/permease/ATPase subunit [Oceanibaculum sp.]|uniref:NHLP family bacteriocin export ABC transporter peptidase/permease/ATPase subunit n=1 Tax=Oceanibaculum sp. TaxID=1903597 RepID=UPI0025906B07|nr:NHLP family bacteriocin export ABC transporter peptidase/permease/ATPase subunit [Oceanibaculum sp.]MCH2394842.1 NHLP family bacteriocin export ABC transporter peptidase/permease/ATPase subunit [Oceanibaculum sp.]
MTDSTSAPVTPGAPAPSPAPKPNAPKGGRRFRTPTILQMEATECGAAALAMILARFGRWVPLEELRVECDVSRDGSKASNILRAARRYGLVAKGYRREPESVTNLPFPMIIFWNFNHFLVLEGIDRKAGKVWLNDPALGPRTVSLEEFDSGFTGVCLVFERTPDFRKGGEKPSIIAPLKRRLRGSQGAMAYVMLATLLLVLPGLVIPVFSKIFVDDVLIGGTSQWLLPLLIGMAVTAALQGILTWLQQIHLSRLEMKLALSSSAQFFWHVLRLPVEFFNQRFPGDISARVSSNDDIAMLLSGQLANNIIGLVMIGFYAIVMLFYDVWLTLIGVGLALLNFLALKAVARRREDSSRKLVNEQGKLAATSISGIQLIETLKSSGSESDFFSKWSGLQAKYLTAQQELAVTTTLISAAPILLSALSTAAILAVGGFRVIDGSLTIGGLVAFQALLANFSTPIEQLVGLGGEIQTVKGSLTRIEDVQKYRIDDRLGETERMFATAAPERPLPPKLRGHIELRDLVFGYNRSDKPLIDGLNLTVQPGQRVALIGGSGSGKSTIAKIVSGLYRPWSGSVLYDGIPLDELPHAYFANSVSTVDQEIFLFAGTVRENIGMWDNSVSEEMITTALRDACILDAIESRADRYESLIAENGGNFSGGQRQRLEIARALAGNPTVLILDEATSALDPVVEKRIDENLRRRGCTCLIVAHRLSTIRDCDEIIVLERGQAAQRGKHEELIAVDGPYRRLIRSGEA